MPSVFAASRPDTRRRAGFPFATALFAFVVAVPAACGDGDGRDLAGVVRDPALDVAAVTFPDAADGREIAMRADPGALLVVYFGYTSCPDICPTTLNDIRIAENELPDNLADRVTVAFATVDPDRDTTEVVQGYLGSFFPEGVALRTDDAAKLATAATAFGVQFEVANHDPGDRSYDVAHTAVTYVVDDTGTVVVEWPFGFASDDMTADLTTLLNEETT